MKLSKVILGILIIIVLGFLSFAIAYDFGLLNNKDDFREVLKDPLPLPANYNLFTTDDNLASIGLPKDYTLSNNREKIGMTFAAQSPKVLVTIKTIPSDIGLDYTQKELVDFLHEYEEQNTTSDNISKSTLFTSELGNNYFLISDGTMLGRDGIRIEYIRQYLTYINNNAFAIDFITPHKEAYDIQEFDIIVSTLQLH